MSDITYTYSIIKYVHDPSVGESLNIGVVLWSPELSILDFRFEHRYERLSKTFAGFDGENYRHHLARFTRALSALGDTQEPTLLSSFVRRCDEVGEFTRQIWTDEDLSFQAGPTLAGITSDIEQALLDIFDRMVTSQYPFTRPRLGETEIFNLLKSAKMDAERRFRDEMRRFGIPDSKLKNKSVQARREEIIMEEVAKRAAQINRLKRKIDRAGALHLVPNK